MANDEFFSLYLSRNICLGGGGESSDEIADESSDEFGKNLSHDVETIKTKNIMPKFWLYLGKKDKYPLELLISGAS